jgi:hypothetical protein
MHCLGIGVKLVRGEERLIPTLQAMVVGFMNNIQH